MAISPAVNGPATDPAMTTAVSSWKTGQMYTPHGQPNICGVGDVHEQITAFHATKHEVIYLSHATNV